MMGTSVGAAAFQAGGEAPAGARSVRLSLDDGLQRIWKEVFEQSKVVLASTPDDSLREEGDSWAAQAEQPAVSPRATHRPAVISPGMAPIVQPSGATSDLRIAAAAALAGLSARGILVPLPSSSLQGIAADPVDPLRRDRPRLPHSAEPDRHGLSAMADLQPNEAPSDEVVQVFHCDGSVAIVVRDLRLGADAALRCALETARQLTGDPRALKQVTLNGRNIFQSDNQAGGGVSHRPSLVSFTC